MLEAASFDEMDVGHNRLDVVIKGESKQEFGAISTGPSLLAASTGTRQAIIGGAKASFTWLLAFDAHTFTVSLHKSVTGLALGAYGAGSALDAIAHTWLALSTGVAEIAFGTNRTPISVDVITLDTVGDVGTYLASGSGW